MEQGEILNQTNQLFKKTLDDETIELGMETTANDVDDWDSLNHPVLISEIEKHFNVTFKLKEVIGFKNVGDIVNGIQAKLMEKEK